MEPITELYGFVIGKQMSIPLWAVMAYITFISFCLLFGRHSLGLVITYCFVFYLGFIFNLANFTDMLNDTRWGLSLYVISGITMLIIAITGFFIDNKQ